MFASLSSLKLQEKLVECWVLWTSAQDKEVAGGMKRFWGVGI